MLTVSTSLRLEGLRYRLILLPFMTTYDCIKHAQFTTFRTTFCELFKGLNDNDINKFDTIIVALNEHNLTL